MHLGAAGSNKSNKHITTISGWTTMATWVYFIIEIPPVVHPRFRQPSIVMVYYFPSASWEGIGGGFSENMADVGAGDY